jgi:chromosome partitioning protein
MREADMVAKVSIINMKGGVGKSTLCTQLAWHFSAKWGWDKRVLVIDLDPQFNASQYVLGVQRYQHDVIDADRPTVWDIFEQASRTPGLKSSGRSLSNPVLNVVSYHDGARLDIIASQLELSYTLKNPNQKEHLLSAFVDSIEDNYDLILVDCAPTESGRLQNSGAECVAGRILHVVIASEAKPSIRRRVPRIASSLRSSQ